MSIRDYLRKHGITARQLAIRSGVQTMTISRALRGRCMSYRNAKALELATGGEISADELQTGAAASPLCHGCGRPLPLGRPHSESPQAAE